MEISNPGHNFNYKKFSSEQINSIVKLSSILIKKYRIKPENILGHSDVAPDRKKDPGENFPWQYLYEKKIALGFDLNQKFLFKKRGQKTTTKEKKIFVKNLNKIGYTKNLKMNQTKYLKMITKAFQRRFRQKLIDGNIDQECLIISNNLIEQLKK